MTVFGDSDVDEKASERDGCADENLVRAKEETQSYRPKLPRKMPSKMSTNA